MMEATHHLGRCSLDDRAVLELIYRSRPATVAELASIAHRDEDELIEVLETLRARGAVGVRDGVLEYPHPSAWTAELVERETRALRESTYDAAGRIESLVAELPGMLRHWAVGEASGDLVPLLSRHGPRAAEDLWYDTSHESAGSAWAVLPDVSRFLHGDPERAARFARAFAGKKEVRGLVPRSADDDPRLLALAEHYSSIGVSFRLADELPSWFWVDGDLLALPYAWGVVWPTSVLGVRNAALADLGRALFEELWRRADPIGAATQPWTPLLRLMREGVTLDAASRTLGVNPRTGRRRVAAAMEHYGVSTLFALGVAWAADRGRDV